MSGKSLGWKVVGAAIGLLGAIAAGPAQATLYSGNWDPTYGGQFPDLGWKASAEFDVPASCLAQANGSYLPIGKCAGFSVSDAELDFYNASVDSNPDTSPIVQSFALNSNVFVGGIDIMNNQFTGVDTAFFNAVVPTTDAALAIAGDGSFAFSLILYAGDLAQLIFATPPQIAPLCESPLAPFLFGNGNCGVSATASTGVIRALPEPATLALALGGFAALGFVARRRKS
jgi:PEP-CTERM motif